MLWPQEDDPPPLYDEWVGRSGCYGARWFPTVYEVYRLSAHCWGRGPSNCLCTVLYAVPADVVASTFVCDVEEG